MNNWKNLWGQRSVDPKILSGQDKRAVFLELKRSNGFDVMEGGLTYEALVDQYQRIKKELSFYAEDTEVQPMKSVFEVGCGSGANLYLFENDGIQCGGLDYSEHLIEGAKQVLHTTDVSCDEAIHLKTEPKYDAVLSNSVFSYFVDEKYAYSVLEKMYEKAKHTIGIIDIHDIEKKEDFICFRKKNVKDYEKRYQNLPKFFYSKQFFLEFAESHNMDIKFTHSNTKDYWNNDFVFNCYMYK